MNQLHPGARWLFRLRAYPLLSTIGIFITFLSLPILKFFAGGSVSVLFILAIIFYVLCVLIVAEAYARMSYARWLYEITNDGIKIEHGIIWKKYTSIPYERIQNVDIKRGIIARTFKFSSMNIETAGQSGFSGDRHYRAEGHLPAIDMAGAEKIREFVMKKIKQTNRGKQGL